MSLEAYDKYYENIWEDLFTLEVPAIKPDFDYSRILSDLTDELNDLIHKELFTSKDIKTFLISYIRLISASNGQYVGENPTMGFIDIFNASRCYYIGNEPNDYGCKLSVLDKRLDTYIDFLKRTFLIFFHQLHEKNPDLIPLLKTMDFIEYLHKAIQCLFYFAGSKLIGKMYSEFGFGSFITELQALLPDTIELSCGSHDDYGWGRFIFFKSCNNKRTQGKVYIGCTAGYGYSSVNRNSDIIDKGKGPICDEPAAVGAAAEAAAPEAAGGAGLDPAGAAPAPRRARNTRRSRNSRKRRNTRRRY